MPALLDTQRALRRALVLGQAQDIAELIHDGGIGAADRIDIYRHTATTALVKVLRLSYPAVQSLVGAEFFEGAARIFLTECWPAAPLLDDYGADFGAFLAGLHAAACLPYLGDVARVEWAVQRALHAPQAPPLDLRRLAQLGDEVRLVPDPTLSLLDLNWPADEIWRAAIDTVFAPEVDALSAIVVSAAPRWLLVQRTAAGGVDMQRLCYSQWRFTQLLCADRSLAQALAEMAIEDKDFAPEPCLAELLAAGRFVDFVLDTPVRPELAVLSTTPR